MKKYIILACLLFASIAVGQDEEPPPTDEPDEGSAVVVSRCFDGVDDNVTEVFCDFGEQNMGACQTKIEERVSSVDGSLEFRSVVRVCTTREACMNNAAGNAPKCFPGENFVRLCFFCCNSDLCNQELTIDGNAPDS